MLFSRLLLGWRSANIYRLPDGRYADPLAAYKLLAAGNINKLLDERDAADPKKYAAADSAVCELVRRAFGLSPLNPKTGRGFSDQDCLDILEAFLGYIEKKGQRGQPSVMKSQVTATPIPPTPTSDCNSC